ncbi:MAG: hypothetical protein HY690_14615 [Chloroflexi bacterium]|nr:hypothetical protein [Chloroflexota bacterium]
MAQVAPQTLVLRREQSGGVARLALRRTANWMSLLALLAGLVCLIYLIAISSVLGAGYDLQRLERERDEWRARNEQLELELAKARSLTWVESQATTRLGMVKSEALTYVRVDQPAPLGLEPVRPAVDAAARPGLPQGQATPLWRELAERVGAVGRQLALSLAPGRPALESTVGSSPSTGL